MHRLAACLVVSSVVVVGLPLGGCSRILGTDGLSHPDPIPHYAGDKAGLELFLGDVLVAAKKDDRGRVHDLLASTILSDVELAELLGADKAKALTPRYHQLMATLVNRGAIELVAQIYERKYDAVEAAPETDPVVAAALTQPLPRYAARFKRAADDKGLRYDFFIYFHDRWATGNQLGKFLK